MTRQVTSQQDSILFDGLKARTPQAAAANVTMPAARPWKVEPSNMNDEASPYLKSLCY